MKIFKNLLLQNHTAYYNQTWHKTSLGKGDSVLYKWRTIPFFPRGDNSEIINFIGKYSEVFFRWAMWLGLGQLIEILINSLNSRCAYQYVLWIFIWKKKFPPYLFLLHFYYNYSILSNGNSRYTSGKPETVMFSVMAADNKQWVSLESPSIEKSDV